jgi:hypothetical protein
MLSVFIASLTVPSDIYLPEASRHARPTYALPVVDCLGMLGREIGGREVLACQAQSTASIKAATHYSQHWMDAVVAFVGCMHVHA